MSKINTGPINTSYPVTGRVNTTQGFRDNWQSIKYNTDLASTEITELQSKVLLKSPLNGVTINNNMDGTLISNALTQNYRHTTINLGNNISGTLTIDVSAADVQYATITGPVTLQFTGWPAPSANTASVQSNVQLILQKATTAANSQIIFPSTVVFGTTTLEQYSGNGSGGYVTIPVGEDHVHYNFTSTTQGSTIEVQPLNRPRIRANAATGTVQSFNLVSSQPGFITAGGPVTTSGNITITNTGVTSVSAGSGISLSGSTGAVTVTNLVGLSQVPLGAPNPLGLPGDVAGRVFLDGTFLYVCTGTYNGTTAIWKRTNISSY